jgi:preprotein translocase subunit SecF
VLKKIRFDIIRARNFFFALSLLIIIPGIVSLFVQKLNYGVDFTGGRILQFQADRKVAASEIENIIGRFDIKHNPVQLLSGDREFLVRTVDYSDEKEKAAFNERVRLFKIALNVDLYKIDPEKFVLTGLEGKLEQAGVDDYLQKKGYAPGTAIVVKNKEIPAATEDGSPTFNVTLRLTGTKNDADVKKLATEIYTEFDGYRQFSKEDKVDPVFGIELKKKAIMALIVATLGILIYVTLRFEFWYAIAAILALAHDCLVLTGFYSLFRVEVDSAFVAVVLTVFGYSINDTIVIFDRIRENLRKDKKMPLGELMNKALWETMARSINTVMTVEFTILAILFFGGNSIKSFALGLCVGITSGCYSSIFVAAPLAYVFKRREAGRREAAVPAAAAGRARKPAAQANKEPARSEKPSKPLEKAATTSVAPDQRKKQAPAAVGSIGGDSDTGGSDDSKNKKKKQKGKQRRR